jgi:hypothetical protein
MGAAKRHDMSADGDICEFWTSLQGRRQGQDRRRVEQISRQMTVAIDSFLPAIFC